MKPNTSIPKDVDSYIAGFPTDIQEILEKLRATIRKAAPEAKETISYQMPAYMLKGSLVYFAAFTNHIGFYPTPSGILFFKHELKDYKSAKGFVQFPINKPIPYDIITRIVEFRVQENLEKAELNAKKK